MASKLKAKKPEDAKPSKPKILIFGRSGIGKTWTALDFPKCYFIDTEGGANLPHYTQKLKKSGGVYFGIEEGSQDFREIIEQVKALATEKHDYKTLVIDSLSHIMLLDIATQTEKMMKAGSDMTKTYGAERKPAVSLVKQLVHWIEKVDMNVLIIAHEKAEWLNDKQVGVTFDAWDKLEYILHLALNIKKEGESRKAYVRKSRLEAFPDSDRLDWSYDEIAKRIGKQLMESDAKPFTLATAEQVAEVKRLLETIKLTDSTKDKWIADNVDNLSEVESEKVISIIEHLKSKMETVPAFIANKTKGDK